MASQKDVAGGECGTAILHLDILPMMDAPICTLLLCSKMSKSSGTASYQLGEMLDPNVLRKRHQSTWRGLFGVSLHAILGVDMRVLKQF